MTKGTAEIGEMDGELAAYLADLGARTTVIAGPDPTLAQMRLAGRQGRLAAARTGPPMAGRAITLHGMAARLYLPDHAKGLIVYLHGGGWVMLDLDTHDHILRTLAIHSGCAVIGIDYPHAPEVRFPDLPRQCAAAVAEVRARAAEFGPDAARPILAGDSSGANLALAVALGDPAPIAGLMLFYGVYDADFGRPSYRAFGQPPHLLTPQRMAMFWDHYCPPARRTDPMAAPALCPVQALAGLPPVWMAIAGRDVLVDENMAMAALLQDAGVQVDVVTQTDAPHGFIEAIGQSHVADRTMMAAALWAKGI